MADVAIAREKARWRAWAAENGGRVRIDSGAVVDVLRPFLASAVGWVLTYRPRPGEVDLDPLLADHRCCVTRTHSGGVLTVHPADAPVERHRFGYLQPVAGSPEVPLGQVGAVLVPGAVFDVHGGRLGHGSGYYDRLLPRLRPGVPLVGVTTRAFLVSVRLPMEPHDVRMTHLACELGVRIAQP
jgi:5-formyltetrahydrofolate cyclo-ligase